MILTNQTKVKKAIKAYLLYVECIYKANTNLIDRKHQPDTKKFIKMKQKYVKPTC